MALSDLSHPITTTHTHLWFSGAVDGRGAGGLHASAAERLGAGREGRVGDALGRFVLQRWRALPVHLRSLLHLRQATYHSHSQHNQSPCFPKFSLSPSCHPNSTYTTSISHRAVLKSFSFKRDSSQKMGTCRVVNNLVFPVFNSTSNNVPPGNSLEVFSLSQPVLVLCKQSRFEPHPDFQRNPC